MNATHNLPQLSVVIPAYNAAGYIGKCIASILNQDGCIENIEVIIVIDGATDTTLLEAEKASINRKGIVRIVSQENAGPSTSRNTGLTLASADYITFLDADDFWLPNYLETILPLLADDPDLIEYDALRVRQDGLHLNVLKIASASTGTSSVISPDDFLNIFRCYAWARVYRTSLLRQHLFPDGRRFEDTATTPWHYWNSRHSISIGRTLIAYRQHPTSTLATPKPQDIDEISMAATEAAAMYARTGSPYWQYAAYRIFRFACQRIGTQRLGCWLTAMQTAREAVIDVPPPKEFRRVLRFNTILPYVLALYLRSKISNLAERFLPNQIFVWLFSKS